MNIFFTVGIILVVSFFWALKEVNKELSIPEKVKKIKIRKKKGLSGTILFLKEKIIHYSSESD